MNRRSPDASYGRDDQLCDRGATVRFDFAYRGRRWSVWMVVEHRFVDGEHGDASCRETASITILLQDGPFLHRDVILEPLHEAGQRPDQRRVLFATPAPGDFLPGDAFPAMKREDHLDHLLFPPLHGPS